MGLESPQTISGVLRTFVIAIAIILAVDQLGINTALLNDTLSSVIAIAIGGVALAFALGSRGVTSNILSSYYLRERFEPGDHLKLGEQEGTLEAIGTLHAELSTGEGLWIVPNKDLIEAQVMLRERHPED